MLLGTSWLDWLTTSTSEMLEWEIDYSPFGKVLVTTTSPLLMPLPATLTLFKTLTSPLKSKVSGVMSITHIQETSRDQLPSLRSEMVKFKELLLMSLTPMSWNYLSPLLENNSATLDSMDNFSMSTLRLEPVHILTTTTNSLDTYPLKMLLPQISTNKLLFLRSLSKLPQRLELVRNNTSKSVEVIMPSPMNTQFQDGSNGTVPSRLTGTLSLDWLPTIRLKTKTTKDWETEPLLCSPTEPNTTTSTPTSSLTWMVPENPT